MSRFDSYEKLPSGMEEYLSEYGWHFSKAMCKWAVGNMKARGGGKVEMKSKDAVLNILSNHHVTLVNDLGYDAVFVYCMGVSDYLGSSINDDAGLARYVKDVLDDVDGYEGIAFSRFVSDCNGKGIPIIWEDML